MFLFINYKLRINLLIIFAFAYSGVCLSTGWYDGTPVLKDWAAKNIDLHALEQGKRGKIVPEKLKSGRAPDSVNFYIFNFEKNDWETVTCTLRKSGPNSHFYVADSEWGTRMTQSLLDQFYMLFEVSTPQGSIDPQKGFYEIEIESFGEFPPSKDIDGEKEIYLVFVDIKDFYNTSGSFVGGYFTYINEYRKSEQQYSNEHEMLILDTYPTLKAQYLNYAKGVIAHEFQHLLHWGQDEHEYTWVDEGCSELAMFLVGFPPLDHLDDFIVSPYVPLTDWNEPTSELVFSNYGAAYLMMLYLYEHYGEMDMVSNLVRNASVGIKGINQTLKNIGYSNTFKSVFQDWVVANFVDLEDENRYDGRYSYHAVDLSQFGFLGGIQPNGVEDSQPASFKDNIFNWSADYVKFTNFPQAEYAFEFDSPAGDDTFKVQVITRDAKDVYSISEITLDSNGDGKKSFFSFNEFYNNAIVVPALEIYARENQSKYKYNPYITNYTINSTADVDSFTPPQEPGTNPDQADSINIALVQNPYISESVTAYLMTVFDVDSMGVLFTLFFTGDSLTDTLSMSLVDSFNVFPGRDTLKVFYFEDEYILKKGGKFIATASYTTRSGRKIEKQKVYTANPVDGGSGGTAYSPDNALTLFFPQDCFQGTKYFIISDENESSLATEMRSCLFPELTNLLNTLPGQHLTPFYSLSSTVATFNEKVKVSLDLTYLDMPVKTAEKAVFGVFTHGAWELLPASFDTRTHISSTTLTAPAGVLSLFETNQKLPSPGGKNLLAQNYPNPFNPETIIPFKVPLITGSNRKSHVQIIIYNTWGEKVCELFNNLIIPGQYSAVWNGKNQHHASVSSGVYIFTLIIDGVKLDSRKMILIK